MRQETMTFPRTRQGVRDLDRAASGVLPISGGAPASTAPVNVGSNERLLSAIAGGVLALTGLSRGTVLGLGAALAGGALVYRGLSGHCSLYQALGVNTAGQTK